MREESYTLRELEKLKAGLDFCFDDWDIASLKENAILQCAEYNSIHNSAYEKQYMKLKEIAEEVWIVKTFNCDKGKNIFIGNHFFGSYNLTILDAREIFIGDHVMIGPNHSRTSTHSKSKTTTSRKCQTYSYRRERYHWQ